MVIQINLHVIVTFCTQPTFYHAAVGTGVGSEDSDVFSQNIPLYIFVNLYLFCEVKTNFYLMVTRVYSSVYGFVNTPTYCVFYFIFTH